MNIFRFFAFLVLLDEFCDGIGLIVGAIIRYASTKTPATHISVDPIDVTPHYNQSLPPDTLWLKVCRMRAQHTIGWVSLTRHRHLFCSLFAVFYSFPANWIRMCRRVYQTKRMHIHFAVKRKRVKLIWRPFSIRWVWLHLYSALYAAAYLINLFHLRQEIFFNIALPPIIFYGIWMHFFTFSHENLLFTHFVNLQLVIRWSENIFSVIWAQFWHLQLLAQPYQLCLSVP